MREVKMMGYPEECGKRWRLKQRKPVWQKQKEEEKKKEEKEKREKNKGEKGSKRMGDLE